MCTVHESLKKMLFYSTGFHYFILSASTCTFLFHSFIHASLSLIHSHLISDFEAHFSQFTLSTSVSQLPPKLDVTDPLAVPVAHLSQTHNADRLRLTLPSASNPRCWLPQTHFSSADPLQVSCLCHFVLDAWDFDLGITSKNGYMIKECGIFDWGIASKNVGFLIWV